jgi:Tfp pilus assembly protein PilN
MYARLNLATRPLVSHRRFFVGSTLVGAVALILFVGLAWRFYGLRSAAVNLRARSNKIEQELNSVEAQRRDLERYFAQQDAAGFQEHAKFAVGVLQARSINWTQMFMDLEKTLPPGVHVVRIEPKLEKGVVTVHFLVGATNQESKIKMLQAFENSRSFSHVELLGDKAGNQTGADPLTVEFVVEYRTT